MTPLSFFLWHSFVRYYLEKLNSKRRWLYNEQNDNNLYDSTIAVMSQTGNKTNLDCFKWKWLLFSILITNIIYSNSSHSWTMYMSDFFHLFFLAVTIQVIVSDSGLVNSIECIIPLHAVHIQTHLFLHSPSLSPSLPLPVCSATAFLTQRLLCRWAWRRLIIFSPAGRFWRAWSRRAGWLVFVVHGVRCMAIKFWCNR